MLPWAGWGMWKTRCAALAATASGFCRPLVLAPPAVNGDPFLLLLLNGSVMPLSGNFLLGLRKFLLGLRKLPRELPKRILWIRFGSQARGYRRRITWGDKAS